MEYTEGRKGEEWRGEERRGWGGAESREEKFLVLIIHINVLLP